MKKKELDPRLALLYEMAPSCKLAVDVGADHGFLICALVEGGKAERGIAADLKPQPLEKARREAERRGLSAQMDFVLTDGLTGISPEGLGAVVIAGMGGETILHILESWAYRETPGIVYLLQPMTKAERLRQWLWDNGFTIRREECCTAAGRVYTVLEVIYTGEVTSHPAWECCLGKVDPGKDPDSRRYAEDLVRELKKIAAGLERTGEAGDRARAGELRERAAIIGKKINGGDNSDVFQPEKAREDRSR